VRAAHQGAAVDLRELEDAGGGTGLEAYATAPGATLREGRDFQNQAQGRAQRPTVTRRVATDRPLLRALLADPGVRVRAAEIGALVAAERGAAAAADAIGGLLARPAGRA
jgi:hypothetical protein